MFVKVCGNLDPSIFYLNHGSKQMSLKDYYLKLMHNEVTNEREYFALFDE